jgi:ribonuclease HI
MNEQLLRDFTEEEFNEAISQMAPLKSPGPDGLPACFYQDNWATVGPEVCKVVSNFFISGTFDRDLNSTHIVLIPKIKNPTKVSEYRPISLCNVLYKIISKTLANRLKNILPHVISPNQSAFIPGRLISDNVLATYETLHSMHSRMWGKVGYMAVKLDMSKAYDRVEWAFLEAVMKKIGFADKWIGLVMYCVTTVTYSVIINGAPEGCIKPCRGIRQGDPISPYLFLLCAEALSSNFTAAGITGAFRGVPTSPKGPRLNHLFFADDSLVFCRATIHDWNCLTRMLEGYEKASGQKMNREKTSIFFSRNTKIEDKEAILQLSGIPATQRYDKYLGLPALVGKSRVREFEGLVEKVRKRVNDWKVNFLSQAGKEVLLKAVVQAIPTYTMSLFLLPKALCKEINLIMGKFWWGHKSNDKKIHWMSWAKMGRSKAQGGMGFRDLCCFNKALLAKQGWRLLQHPDSLVAKIIKAKYYPHGDFLKAKIGSRPSLAWKSILSTQDLIKEGMIWRIGNGNDIKIWKDRWIPKPSTYLIQSPCQILTEEARVSELMANNNWNIPLIRSIFWEDEAEIICSLPLSRYWSKDKLIWKGTKNGEFTVRSAYFLEQERMRAMTGEGSNTKDGEHIWKAIWSLKVPNSTKVFMWRACCNILPTRDNLGRRGVVDDVVCPLCNREEETVIHALWSCPATQDVWSASITAFQKCSIGAGSFFEVFEAMILRSNREDLALFAATAKGIWHRRNTVVHGGTFSHPNSVALLAGEALRGFWKAMEKKDGCEQSDETEVSIKWTPPPNGCFKANWDIALNKQTKWMGIGVIIRDDQGLVSSALCQTKDAFPEPVTAEAMGALCAIELCKDLGLQDVILEGDAIQVVQAINKQGMQNCCYGQILEDIHAVLRSFRWKEIKHVKREANSAAHTLAKLAASNYMNKVWMEEVPNSILSTVTLECNTLIF